MSTAAVSTPPIACSVTGPWTWSWFQRSPPTWEHNHESPGLVNWNARLASFSRLIVFDKRNPGLSDHAPGPVVLEDTMQDVLAVLDAAGAERPAVYGDLEGAALSALFAATHPERTRALILYAPLVKAPAARTSRGPDPLAFAVPHLARLAGDPAPTPATATPSRSSSRPSTATWAWPSVSIWGICSPACGPP